jgi:hypothetical protein
MAEIMGITSKSIAKGKYVTNVGSYRNKVKWDKKERTLGRGKNVARVSPIG